MTTHRGCAEEGLGRAEGDHEAGIRELIESGGVESTTAVYLLSGSRWSNGPPIFSSPISSPWIGFSLQNIRKTRFPQSAGSKVITLPVHRTPLGFRNIYRPRFRASSPVYGLVTVSCVGPVNVHFFAARARDIFTIPRIRR